MLVDKAYIEPPDQVAGIVYRNIGTKYGLEVSESRCQRPPKVVENNKGKILWNFQIQSNKLVIANQSDIAVVGKHQKTAVVMETAIRSSTIRKKGT